MAGWSQGIEEQLKGLPGKPGVYLFRGERDDVLYVGKAKSLRPRVRSYFQTKTDGRPGSWQLRERIRTIEVIVTGTEVEALHLEQNLVKRHRPPFNVRLRDDKSFPYIAVTVEDEYPRVMFTRERHRRGVWYFGPYANAKKVRETLDVLNRVFQFRPCEGPKPGRHSGIPCLDYHIERCTAPCVGYVSKEDYRRDHRRGDRVPLGRDEADPARARAEDAGGGGRASASRRRPGTGTGSSPSSTWPSGRRRTGGRGHDRRNRDRRRRRPGGRAGVPAPGRQDGRPARVPPGERGGPGPRHRARGVRARVLRLGSGRAAAADRAAGVGDTSALAAFLSERRGSRVEVRVPERGEKRRLAELAAENARARAGVGAVAVGAARAPPRRGARGAARGAQPRVAAAPDRVLRHLEDPGRVGRRLDGRLPGRDRRRRRTTASSACGRSRARTTSQRWRRSSPAASRG